LATQFVTATEVTATVIAAEIANVGSNAVSVQTAAWLGTNALRFEVDSAASTAGRHVYDCRGYGRGGRERELSSNAEE